MLTKEVGDQKVHGHKIYIKGGSSFKKMILPIILNSGKVGKDKDLAWEVSVITQLGNYQ